MCMCLVIYLCIYVYVSIVIYLCIYIRLSLFIYMCVSIVIYLFICIIYYFWFAASHSRSSCCQLETLWHRLHWTIHESSQHQSFRLQWRICAFLYWYVPWWVSNMKLLFTAGLLGQVWFIFLYQYLIMTLSNIKIAQDSLDSQLRN